MSEQLFPDRAKWWSPTFYLGVLIASPAYVVVGGFALVLYLGWSFCRGFMLVRRHLDEY